MVKRVLICLYALLNFVVSGNACLFSMSPRITSDSLRYSRAHGTARSYRDLGGTGHFDLAPSRDSRLSRTEFGLVFERVGPGPVRVRNYKPDQSLPPSEQIARVVVING